MRIVCLIGMLLLSTSIFAQQRKGKELKAPIKSVKVFKEGAQVTRQITYQLAAGEQTLRFTGLSPQVDPSSVRVRIEGEATLLGVRHEKNFLNELEQNERADSLRQLVGEAEDKRRQQDARNEVLTARLDLLDKNNSFAGGAASDQLAALKEALVFYETQLTAIKEEQMELNREKTALQYQIALWREQLKVIAGEEVKETSEVIVKVEAARRVPCQLMIDYLVTGAGWVPKYDVRVEDINSPVALVCKAEVYQRTGVDWENVDLTLSNANPREGGQIKKLHKWELNYKRFTRLADRPIAQPAPGALNPYTVRAGFVIGRITDEDGYGLPGVNVIIKGTTTGTISDIDGFYSLNAPMGATLVFSYIGYQSEERVVSTGRLDLSLSSAPLELQEVVITAYGAPRERRKYKNAVNPKQTAPPVTVMERQTTVEYEVDRPYTISSTGESMTVNLQNIKLAADYAYYAVPKLDEDAFLIARIPAWGTYNLPQGEANLYFEEGYVGKSMIDTDVLEDTLELSLGRDKNIIISREEVSEFSKRRTLGSNKVDSRMYEIKVFNKKSEAIRLTLFDQVPIPIINQIAVTVTEQGAAAYDADTGELRWEQTLPAQEQYRTRFGYEVKYPKREQVILE